MAIRILSIRDALPAGTAIRTELSEVEVVPVGESGAHGWSTVTTTVGTPPSTFSFGGAISLMLEREDGQWRLAGGRTSSSTGR